MGEQRDLPELVVWPAWMDKVSNDNIKNDSKLRKACKPHKASGKHILPIMKKYYRF